MHYPFVEGVFMAGSTSMSGGGAPVPRQSMEESEVTGWVGWIVFAGTMMTLLGVFHMFEGLVALFRHSFIWVRLSWRDVRQRLGLSCRRSGFHALGAVPG